MARTPTDRTGGKGPRTYAGGAPPAAPPSLTEPAALARWTALQAKAARHGRTLDPDLLAGYCQVWARWRQAEEAVGKAGQLAVNAKGRVVASPLVTLANQASTQMRGLERQLNLRDLEEDPSDDTDSDLCTRRELARRLVKHPQTITKWEREGLPIAERGRRGRPSRYSETGVRAWLQAREELAKAAPGAVDFMASRARKELAQAALAEQTLQIRARTLLPLSEVERLWLAEVAAMRAVLLAAPTTYADRVCRAATLDGVAGVEREIRSVVHEALRELANPDRPYPPPAPSA